jgi:hypothetical protein
MCRRSQRTYGFARGTYSTCTYLRRLDVGALLEACLEIAHEVGIRKLYLRATDDGRPLYERAGFAPSDLMDLQISRYYHNGDVIGVGVTRFS